MILLPRLHRHEIYSAASALERTGLEPEGARDVIDDLRLKPHWNRSGGAPATSAQRKRFVEALEKKAVKHGYPNPPSLVQQRGFDRSACRILATDSMLAQAGGELLRSSCWAGLTLLDTPHLVVWRHGAGGRLSRDRLVGGQRNFLRRLWLRTEALRLPDSSAKNPWIFIDRLTEDAFVQIIERPSIAAFPPLAQAIAQIWLLHAAQHRNMEALMRLATKRLRAIRETVCLEALSKSELVSEVKRVFSESARVLECGSE